MSLPPYNSEEDMFYWPTLHTESEIHFRGLCIDGGGGVLQDAKAIEGGTYIFYRLYRRRTSFKECSISCEEKWM